VWHEGIRKGLSPSAASLEACGEPSEIFTSAP
jgi:hypothetical protein